VLTVCQVNGINYQVDYGYWIWAVNGYDAQRTFCTVVIDLKLSVVDVARARGPSREGVANRRSRIVLA
jgi:hypothetical protein